MSGMDRLSVLDLEYMRAWHEGDNLVARAVSELLAHRRASQAAPAVEICQFCHDAGASACACFEAAEMGHAQAAPAPSDGLREALEPFAKAADIKLCGEWRDDQSISRTDVAFSITFGDLRRARAALTPAPAQEGGE